MCGIVGAWKRSAPLDRASIMGARDALACRGPDAAGIIELNDGQVMFAHRRLSVIDLSEQAGQPMQSSCGRFTITYNGEVYNYRDLRAQLVAAGVEFRTDSDTEVVLNAYMYWGGGCLDRFVGMFAFSVWDSVKRRMFLARDRMGQKPLYYYWDGHQFLFASRLKPLIAWLGVPKIIDEHGLKLFLESGYVPAPLSIISGVRKLSPGCSAHLVNGSLTVEPYWSLDTVVIDERWKSASATDVADELDRLVRDAVVQRMISDVPLGAFLSGGIDSSLISAVMASTAKAPVKAFTIDFDSSGYGEGRYAKAVATHIGAEHYVKTMNAGDLIPLLDNYSDHYDEPFGDPSALPTLILSKFARQHVTVALSGDGGDELFAGYRYYRYIKRLEFLMRAPWRVRRRICERLQVRSHRGTLLANAISQRDWVSAFTFMRSMSKDTDINAIVPSGSTRSIEQDYRERLMGFPTLDVVAAASRLDARYYLVDDILQKVDVASMSVGLEARSPLMDHRIVEFAFSLPSTWKMRHGSGKWLLRQVLARYVPKELFERPKQGFNVPLREWMRSELRGMVSDLLSKENVANTGVLDPEAVNNVLKLHLSGVRDTHPMLWNLVAFVQWWNGLEVGTSLDRIVRT